MKGFRYKISVSELSSPQFNSDEEFFNAKFM